MVPASFSTFALFCLLTKVGFVLSLADGVLSGVKPPAGDFSRGRKVTKSPLKTYGFKNSLVLTWNDSPPGYFASVASDAPSTCPVRTNTALRCAALLGRRWLLRLPFLPHLSCCGVEKGFANEETEVFHKIRIFGENFRAGNCRDFCDHQGSAPKRGNRGTRTPRCCVSGTKPQ